ncbi:hypothetical protein F2Q69_00050260 [Brassica cretica]|uniref:Ubiquitin-like protease family profile domain-containing protein n=1 Tax=Brassica cretica TaxID=69181 RepID=A0A8S9PYD1_BRACR|nr:hypothetical protein F2Q69_00050260 [Brassica cretica]
MIWNDSHWAGLPINLDLGLVEILDLLPSLYSVRCVAKFMKPLVDSLPYVVKKVAMCEQTQFRGLKPFMWNRIPDLYTDTHSGDCGPVSMKFLEMHAHGDPRHLRLMSQTDQEALLQINRLLDDKTTSSGTNDNSTIATEDTLQSPNLASDANNSRSQVINITVAAIALGTMAWLYAKITN